MDIYIVDDKVVILSDADQRAVDQIVALQIMDLQSAVRLAAAMQDDAPDD